MKARNRTIGIYILILAVAFEALGALYGGFNLINDPSGERIRLPISFLEGSIFSSYLIPGIILFLLLGFFPFFLIFPLFFKPNWPLINGLNIYRSYHWAWTYTLYTAIILIIWINTEMMILGTGSIIQGFTGLLGVFILIVTLTPGVKRYYKLQIHSRHNSNSHGKSGDKIFHGYQS